MPFLVVMVIRNDMAIHYKSPKIKMGSRLLSLTPHLLLRTNNINQDGKMYSHFRSLAHRRKSHAELDWISGILTPAMTGADEHYAGSMHMTSYR